MEKFSTPSLSPLPRQFDEDGPDDPASRSFTAAPTSPRSPACSLRPNHNNHNEFNSLSSRSPGSSPSSSPRKGPPLMIPPRFASNNSTSLQPTSRRSSSSYCTSGRYRTTTLGVLLAGLIYQLLTFRQASQWTLLWSQQLAHDSQEAFIKQAFLQQLPVTTSKDHLLLHARSILTTNHTQPPPPPSSPVQSPPSFVPPPPSPPTIVLSSPSKITTTTATMTNPTPVGDSKEEDIFYDRPPANRTEPAPYAYMFVLGAIHEGRPAYRGFLYNVLITVHILRRLGSTADFWLYTQLSPNSTLSHLPDEDTRLLQAMHIHVFVLERPETESFAHLVYEKFRPLQMTSYRRVMFLDADIIPLANLDYLFHLSDEEHFLNQRPPPGAQVVENRTWPLLRPNLIVATRGEPCNAGLFILQPGPGDYEQLQEIVRQQHEAAKDLPYPHFDRDHGWGHSFQEAGDMWEAIKLNGRRWGYHASHSDQGLLYYWVKYYKQDVSIVIGRRVQNWIPGNNSQPQLQIEYHDELTKHSAPQPLSYQNSCNSNQDYFTCMVPYRDYAHFYGSSKPWQSGVNKWFMKSNDQSSLHGPYRIWFNELRKLNKHLNMSLDIDQWDVKYLPVMKESPLGYIAKYGDHAARVNSSS